MANSQFVFSGPVTIHVYGTVATSQIVEPVAAPPPPVVPEKVIRFDRNYDDREGYDPKFLSAELTVPLPSVTDARKNELLTDAGGKPMILPYHHFSLAMNASRRLQMWSAVNVDYDNQKKSGSRASFGTDKWIPDPRIPERAQIFDSEIYAPAGQIDRGHIVRREDNAYGNSDAEREFANSDTFHWTNCTPQHQAFNRASPGSGYDGIKGLWGDFEDYIQKSLQKDDTKACILAGPVLADDDPTVDLGGGPVKYPVVFWKVVVVTVPAGDGKRGLQAFGFVLSQKDVVDKFGIEIFTPGRFKSKQRTLREITALTGVVFDDALYAANEGG